MADNSSRVKVEQFRDWKNRLKWGIHCKRHGYYAETYLEDNAHDLAFAHEVCHHGKSIKLSDWAISRQFVGKL